MEKNIIGAEVFNRKKNHFKTKHSAGIIKNLKYIASSKPILLITSLLLCYFIIFDLTDSVWKKTAEIAFNKDPNRLHKFFSNVEIYVSILSIFCTIIGVYVLSSCRWVVSALVTPIMVLIAGGIFFCFMILGEFSAALAIKSSLLTICVYAGAANNVFSRATKYTFFDSTKEMIYIPLDDDLQIKGKAAAETIGMKFGKGSGALIQQILFGLFPTCTLMDLSTFIFIIFAAVVFWWIYSIVNLSKRLLPSAISDKN